MKQKTISLLQKAGIAVGILILLFLITAIIKSLIS